MKSNTKSDQNYKKKKDHSKKTDGDDEETKGFIEMQSMKDNNHKINVLENQVSAIKGIGVGLGN